ncbi:hypothetical protein [Streptomyces sp. NBC_00690]|uniref:hypothetical protein n=1 Tax=Streptomyces sp. NBC_00690 TaxID=2975808 RepID=UPI002E2AB866|nr:hypothetical protein [Streptomyces sp. NBC_00690]
MGIFSRKGNDNEDPYELQDAIDRMKLDGAMLRRIDQAHTAIGCGDDSQPSGQTSGPSSPSASTHKKGRRW